MKADRFHRDARAELLAAGERYVAISPQLGGRFYDTIDGLVDYVR